MECNQDKSNPPPNGKTNTNKPTKLRCHFCNKKLSLIHFDCKCGHKFCQNHLNPHSHNCKFDYCKERKEILEKNNPKIEVKFAKIPV